MNNAKAVVINECCSANVAMAGGGSNVGAVSVCSVVGNGVVGDRVGGVGNGAEGSGARSDDGGIGFGNGVAARDGADSEAASAIESSEMTS